MCRFALYLGPPIRVESLVFDGSHSLARQSLQSTERASPVNGDGFGIAWYQPALSPWPAVFRSVKPAWSNRNLADLARVIASPAVLAHVREASAHSLVDEVNTHPFRFRHLLFMHNGDLGAFPRVRRRLLSEVSDAAYANVFGTTDSEVLFALFVDELGAALERPSGADLADALQRTIARAVETVARWGGGEPSYLNLAVSDGRSGVASRFTSDPKEPPESLHFLAGRLSDIDPGRFENGRVSPCGPAVFVASEPLNADPRWRDVPPNHLVIVGADREPELREIRTAR